jgi:AraC-like DNA-binding protein
MPEESSYSCAFALATLCQRVVCEFFSDPAAFDVRRLGARFADVPHATLYTEAAVASSILVQFTVNLGRAIHQGLHASPDARGCRFDPESSTPPLWIDRARPVAWRPAEVITAWAERFNDELGRTHDLLAERARRHLMQHAAQRIPMSALARDAAASASVVHRRFVATVGETPLQYRTRRRVLAAIPLIRQGYKIDVVASEVGWKKRKDLYRALRDVAGLSPAQIRSLAEHEAGDLLVLVGRHQDNGAACV